MRWDAIAAIAEATASNVRSARVGWPRSIWPRISLPGSSTPQTLELVCDSDSHIELFLQFDIRDKITKVHDLAPNQGADMPRAEDIDFRTQTVLKKRLPVGLTVGTRRIHDANLKASIDRQGVGEDRYVALGTPDVPQILCDGGSR